MRADKPTITNVGLVRPYKRLERLVSFARTHRDVNLVIAGSVQNTGYGEELEAQAAELDNVALLLRYVPDSDLKFVMKSSDLFVIPHDTITNSGSALMALTFGVPVLAPQLSVFDGLRQRFGPELFMTYESPESLEATIVEVLSRSRRIDPADVPWGDLEWSSIAARTVQFYETLTTVP